jgi:hypothetical protein
MGEVTDPIYKHWRDFLAGLEGQTLSAQAHGMRPSSKGMLWRRRGEISDLTYSKHSLAGSLMIESE